MDYKTKVAQTRLSPSVVRDVNRKLEKTGLTMSVYKYEFSKNFERKPSKLFQKDKTLRKRFYKTLKKVLKDSFYKVLRTHKVNTSKW